MKKSTCFVDYGKTIIPHSVLHTFCVPVYHYSLLRKPPHKFFPKTHELLFTKAQIFSRKAKRRLHKTGGAFLLKRGSITFAQVTHQHLASDHVPYHAPIARKAFLYCLPKFRSTSYESSKFLRLRLQFQFVVLVHHLMVGES